MTSPRTVSVLSLVCDQGKQISDLRAELYKVQQELTLSQKAVEVLAGVMRDIGKCPAEVLCIDDFDTINFDCEHCNDNAEREYRNGIKCWQDYAYAKAKEKEGER